MRLALLISLAVAVVLPVSVFSQAPIISTFTKNGELVCTNLQPGSLASVEWAPSLDGPWTNNWAGLDPVTVDSNGTIQVAVPMFYRVRGTPAPPAGMVLIPAGPFVMGDTFSEGDADELPPHTNTISAFYIDQYEVTKVLWDQVYQWATNHGYRFDSPFSGRGKAPNHPAQYMTWYDAVAWCNARSELEGRVPAYYIDAAQSTVYQGGQVNLQNDWVKWNAGYRLPTEAEWEKAARGGVPGTRFPWADTNVITHSRANYNSSSAYAYDVSPTRGYHPRFQSGADPYTSPVGYFAPNGYGLYDMAGNVWEWCWDWWDAYPVLPALDPRGPTSGSYRVVRGGCWINAGFYCRVARRGNAGPTFDNSRFGFRSVLPQVQP